MLEGFDPQSAHESRGGDGQSPGEGERGTHTGRAPAMRRALRWEALHGTSELIFTTLTFKLKKAQRERTNLAQGHRASKQQNQDVYPGSLGPKAKWTRTTGKYHCP